MAQKRQKAQSSLAQINSRNTGPGGPQFANTGDSDKPVGKHFRQQRVRS